MQGEEWARVTDPQIHITLLCEEEAFIKLQGQLSCLSVIYYVNISRL